MAAAKTDAQKAADAKKKADKAAADAAVLAAQSDAQLAKYSAEDLAKIAELKDKGVVLTLEESSEELDAKLAAHEDTGDSGVAKEDSELPSQLPPRYQAVVIDGKPRRFAVHFVHSVNGKGALYNEFGTRISPVFGSDDVLPGSEGSSPTNAMRSISKAAVKNNAMRRQTMTTADYLAG